MILGLFNGTTVASVSRRIVKVNEEQKAIRTSIESARADRVAAIKELQQELDNFARLSAQI